MSVGSSATVRLSAQYDGVTELQPGMYVFNDWYLVEREAASVETCALHVLTTVIRHHQIGVLWMLDLSPSTWADILPVLVWKVLKCIGSLRSMAGLDYPVRPRPMSDLFIPYHVCPCVNQFDKIYVDGVNVVNVWEIKARGCVT